MRLVGDGGVLPPASTLRLRLDGGEHLGVFRRVRAHAGRPAAAATGPTAGSTAGPAARAAGGTRPACNRQRQVIYTFVVQTRYKTV